MKHYKELSELGGKELILQEMRDLELDANVATSRCLINTITKKAAVWFVSNHC
jgi:hypothetical protein